MRLPFDPDAWMFVIPLGIAALVLWLLGWLTPGWVALALMLFSLYFFRDPERVIPEQPNAVVAPADGKVVKIDTAYQSQEFPQGAICVSIFLSVFNVHVQRAPFAGTVFSKSYHPGKFMAAWDHRASEENERSLMVMETAHGKIGVKQIAGLVARRVVLRARVGQRLERGERIGLIRFGSRVDLIVPPEFEIAIKIGDIVTGGETIMARAWKNAA